MDGRLQRSWRDGRVSVPGFLDDHAGMAVGLFALYAATGETDWYREAMRLTGQLARFANPDGGFYATPDDGEALVKRPTDQADNPLPSGNALAAEALLMASLYTGEVDYRTRAEAALRSVAALSERYPSMVGHHLAIIHSLHRGTRELAVVGPDWQGLADVYWKRFRPHIALAGSDKVGEGAPPLLADRSVVGATTAYVCEGFACNLPTSEPEELARQLG